MIKILKENGSNDYIIVRSAFNGEDLPNYSAAGIYRSYVIPLEPDTLYDAITLVAESKWSNNAISSRQKHGILDEAILPTVILQNHITPDYKFTLYKDFDNNKMRLEIYSDDM